MRIFFPLLYYFFLDDLFVSKHSSTTTAFSLPSFLILGLGRKTHLTWPEIQAQKLRAKKLEILFRFLMMSRKRRRRKSRRKAKGTRHKALEAKKKMRTERKDIKRDKEKRGRTSLRSEFVIVNFPMVGASSVNQSFISVLAFFTLIFIVCTSCHWRSPPFHP